ncbi:MAG TPA: hypothetical protein VL463_26165 [Kofleriaceae bacterium]|nr:hypothetical protein [Kofleriaceae bacterium]
MLFAACGGANFVRVDDVPLGHVVVYRNGIAYYERAAVVTGGTLAVRVPRALVDDFLKTLTVFDRETKQPLPVRFPRDRDGGGDMIDMNLTIPNRGRADVVMTYVTEAPAWKPSYRMVIGDSNGPSKGKVFLEGWAIIDNTSGEDWKDVKIGVGSSSAMSFRFDLWSVRSVEREELKDDQRFAAAPPTALAPMPAGSPPGDDGKDEVVTLDQYGTSFSGSTSLENQYYVDGVNTTGAETVTVTESAPTIDPTSTTQGAATIDQEYTKRVAVPGRTYETALGAAAGAQSDPYDGPAPAPPPPPDPKKIARDRIAQLAKTAMHRRRAITITSYARGNTPVASITQEARSIKDQLVDVGVPTNRIKITTQTGAPSDTVQVALVPLSDVAPAQAAASDAPIGEERFTAPGLMTVPKATSAMVPILRSETSGEVVYLYDPISARGDARYAFRSVHLVNPTTETLEGGPIAVYGDDHFIGEGITEQVPPHGTAVVPFALDRQVVVEQKADRQQQLRRILAADRGVVRAEMQDLRATVLTLQSRLTEPTTVYLLHPVDDEWTPIDEPVQPERIAGALLYPIKLKAGERRTVKLTESRPLERSIRLDAPDTTELLEAYVATPDAEPHLKLALQELLARHRALVEQQQRIASLRERVAEYRARQDELHAEIVSLEKAKSGGELLDHLKKKMKEVSDKVSELTVEIVDGEEKALVARVSYQDGIAELHLDDATAPAAAAAK